MHLCQNLFRQCFLHLYQSSSACLAMPAAFKAIFKPLQYQSSWLMMGLWGLGLHVYWPKWNQAKTLPSAGLCEGPLNLPDTSIME